MCRFQVLVLPAHCQIKPQNECKKLSMGPHRPAMRLASMLPICPPFSQTGRACLSVRWLGAAFFAADSSSCRATAS